MAEVGLARKQLQSEDLSAGSLLLKPTGILQGGKEVGLGRGKGTSASPTGAAWPGHGLGTSQAEGSSQRGVPPAG